MSAPEPEPPDRQALAHLDSAVDTVLRRLEELEREIRESEETRNELEALLERFRSGDEDPAEVSRKAESLAEENRMLKERLRKGRDAVDRILARVRFLEEKR